MIEIGLALTPGPLKGQPQQWLANYDHVVPHLTGLVDSLWMPDHFFWEDMPTYEAMTVVTYLAARFPTFKVGSSVLSQSYRNPALLAKMAATLQALSNGRFILGIGAGWKESEYRAYDYPYPSAKIRLQQLDEALTLIKKMWTEAGPISFAGQHYQVNQAYCEPRPEPTPVVMIGGGGKTTMRLAARHADWWNLSDVDIDVFKQRLAILEAHCNDIGRDFGSIRKTWFGRLVLGSSAEEAQKRGTTSGRSHYAGWNLAGAFVGTPEQVLTQIRPFVDIGVDTFMFEILDIEQADILQMTVEVVLPAIQKLG